MNLTDSQWAALRWIAHNAAEDRDGRDGWCRWGIPEGDPWTWDDYRPLVAAGLVERRETWKDVLLKPTPAGWLALHAAPATELSDPRRNVRGQAFEGDLLPGEARDA